MIHSTRSPFRAASQRPPAAARPAARPAVNRAPRPAESVVAALASGLLLIASLAAPALASEPDAERAAIGSSLYRAYCGSCHGRSGVGDGDVAQYLDPKPADLTRIAARDGGFDFDRVVATIDGTEKVKGHGRGEMPVWGDALLVASGGAPEEQTREMKINIDK